MNEPVADEVRSILDGHIILSRDLAAQGHYPAIDVLQSASRVMTAVTQESHRSSALRLRSLLATYEKQRDLILLGAYEKGSDARVDEAIARIDEIIGFLRQGQFEKAPMPETLARLQAMLGPKGI